MIRLAVKLVVAAAAVAVFLYFFRVDLGHGRVTIDERPEPERARIRASLLQASDAAERLRQSVPALAPAAAGASATPDHAPAAQPPAAATPAAAAKSQPTPPAREPAPTAKDRAALEDLLEETP